MWFTNNVLGPGDDACLTDLEEKLLQNYARLMNTQTLRVHHN